VQIPSGGASVPGQNGQVCIPGTSICWNAANGTVNIPGVGSIPITGGQAGTGNGGTIKLPAGTITPTGSAPLVPPSGIPAGQENQENNGISPLGVGFGFLALLLLSNDK
jgi:hypothetical protein